MGFAYNDIGTILVVTIVNDSGDIVDISGATTKSIKFLKPDETSVTKTAAFTTDGTDGKIQYETVDGDLDVAGLWHIQGYVDISSGDTIFHSSVDKFVVDCVIG